MVIVVVVAVVVEGLLVIEGTHSFTAVNCCITVCVTVKKKIFSKKLINYHFKAMAY